jgi:serine O-acetyltransferase
MKPPNSLEDLHNAIASARQQHPGFRVAVVADMKVFLRYRFEPRAIESRWDKVRQIVRLAWKSDAFLALMFYRLKASLQRRGVPILPELAHKLAMSSAQICIGDPVVVQPGIYVAHGQVVIDGLTRVESNVVLFPWITIGLRGGHFVGPTIERGAQIGTGAKIVGPITVGRQAKVGANAVVLDDVAPHVTVVGIPARPVPSKEQIESENAAPDADAY